MQVTIDGEYAITLEATYKIVYDYLEKCYSCRDSRTHLLNHVRKKYPKVNPENVRRTSQLIQNTKGLFPASPEAQAWRASKQLFITNKINSIGRRA